MQVQKEACEFSPEHDKTEIAKKKNMTKMLSLASD
jgi:hypothetical protein